MIRTSIACVFLVLIGCGGAQDAGEGDDPIDPARLYPLKDGNVWTYDVDTGTDLSALGISRVVEVQGPRVTVENNGSSQDAIVYELRPEGIYRVASGTWLLKRPIEVGATWPATGGREARVQSISEHVEVGAGTFDGCVSVVEAEAGEAAPVTAGPSGTGQIVETVYCPDIGPVIVDTQISTELSGQTVHVRGELRAHMLGEEPLGEDE